MFRRDISNESKPLDGSLPPVPGARPLSEMRRDSELVIVDVELGPAGGRCLELGLVPGAQVRVLADGDPMFLDVDGQRLGISRSCLEHILVTEEKKLGPTSSSSD
jgi:Fe2+ transport system protein FeoA